MSHEWQTLHALSGGGFRFELGHHRWQTTSSTVHEDREPVLALALNTRFIGEGRFGAGASASFHRVGRLTFTPPGIPFEVRGQGGEAQVATIHLASALLDRLTGGVPWDDARLAACCDVLGTPIEAALARLAREAACPGFAHDVLVESVGMMITVELARYLNGGGSPRPVSRRAFSAMELAMIEEIIDGDETPRLESIAERCGVSVRTLTRLFKASTGRTVGDAIAEARIRRAKMLLTDGSLPLKAIAHRAGFSSLSGFCSAFHRAVGVTPGTFRLQGGEGGLLN